MSSDRLKLYGVEIRVRPTPEHPRYFEIGFGWLIIFLLDESPQSAGVRAELIADQLPYERVGEKLRIRAPGTSIDQLPETWKPIWEYVMQMGVCIALNERGIGSYEADFETQFEDLAGNSPDAL
jgi:hypothetical protein